MPKISGPIVAVGDSHFPFASKGTVRRIIDLIRRVKPRIVVQLGDLYDLYSYSRFARSVNIMTPAEETRRGREQAEAFWKAVQSASSNAECFQLLGNHDSRLVKKVFDVMPEYERFMDHSKSLWEFEGVTTQPSEREELIIEGICFQHGYRKFGEHVKHNQMNTVCGHLHLGGVAFMRLGKKTLWELNAGFCADESSVPMSYSRQNKISKHTQGVGLIDQDGPRFIPL